MQPVIKVVIADDNTFLQKVIQEKLSFFSNISVLFCAEHGQEIIDKLQQDSSADLILMDIEMPGMNGIVATEKIKQLYPSIKIIMLTVFDNDTNIFKSIKAGADGYFLKDVKPDELYQGITETLSGGAAMTPSIALKTLKLLRHPPNISDDTENEAIKLTSREVEILEQLSKGYSHILIAQNLFVAPATVRKHIENIYSKLQVHNKMEAVQKAKNRGFI